jgi:hypothetical protein
MQSVLTVLGLGMLGAIAMAFRSSLERVRHQDLGVVSQQWLAEHRQSESHDERR